MTSFRSELAKERASLQLLANPQDLDELRQQRDAREREAHAAREAFNAAWQSSPLHYAIRSPLDRHINESSRARCEQDRARCERLEAEAKELRGRVYAIEYGQERATKRLKEIDRLLKAEDDAKTAQTEFAEASREAGEKNLRIDQLASVERELQAEIKELVRAHQEAIACDAANALEQRLSGGALPGTNAAGAVAVDLESRRTTLAACEAQRAELRATLNDLNERAEKARARFLNARGRVAELQLMEWAQGGVPIVSTMIACKNRLWNWNVFDVVDEQAEAIAKAAIEAELREVPADVESCAEHSNHGDNRRKRARNEASATANDAVHQ